MNQQISHKQHVSKAEVSHGTTFEIHLNQPIKEMCSGVAKQPGILSPMFYYGTEKTRIIYACTHSPTVFPRLTLIYVYTQTQSNMNIF